MTEFPADHMRELFEAESRLRDALRTEDHRWIAQEFASVAKALILQASEYERRLGDLNHEYARHKEALATYIPREVYERANADSMEFVRKTELTLADIDRRIKAVELGLVNLPGGVQSLEIGLASQRARAEGADDTKRYNLTQISVVGGIIAVIIGILGWLAQRGG